MTGLTGLTADESLRLCRYSAYFLANVQGIARLLSSRLQWYWKWKRTEVTAASLAALALWALRAHTFRWAVPMASINSGARGDHVDFLMTHIRLGQNWGNQFNQSMLIVNIIVYYIVTPKNWSFWVSKPSIFWGCILWSSGGSSETQYTAWYWPRLWRMSRFRAMAWFSKRLYVR